MGKGSYALTAARAVDAQPRSTAGLPRVWSRGREEGRAARVRLPPLPDDSLRARVGSDRPVGEVFEDVEAIFQPLLQVTTLLEAAVNPPASLPPHAPCHSSVSVP